MGNREREGGSGGNIQYKHIKKNKQQPRLRFLFFFFFFKKRRKKECVWGSVFSKKTLSKSCLSFLIFFFFFFFFPITDCIFIFVQLPREKHDNQLIILCFILFFEMKYQVVIISDFHRPPPHTFIAVLQNTFSPFLSFSRFFI